MLFASSALRVSRFLRDSGSVIVFVLLFVKLSSLCICRSPGEPFVKDL
jgi:hypothetical protein